MTGLWQDCWPFARFAISRVYCMRVQEERVDFVVIEVIRIWISPLTIVGSQPNLGLNEIVGCVGVPSSSRQHAMQFFHSRTMVYKRASSHTTSLVILLVGRVESWGRGMFFPLHFRIWIEVHWIWSGNHAATMASKACFTRLCHVFYIA